MKVVLTGAHGQLGHCLRASCPASVTLIPLDRQALDISDAQQVQSVITDHRPDAIINAAAYNAVDQAEQDRAAAFAINAQGPGFLALAAKSVNAQLVHISTDFVFDGRQGQPYAPDATPAPLSVYGESKATGENAVCQSSARYTLIRTGWVYSQYQQNFVKTMLHLMRSRPALNVVADQIGTPTDANGLAEAIWICLKKQVDGIQHWSDAGIASWYDFAVAIQEEALALGLLEKPIPITPIPAREYPTPAQRPHFSVLDKQLTWTRLGATPNHWRVRLRTVLRTLLKEAQNA